MNIIVFIGVEVVAVVLHAIVLLTDSKLWKICQGLGFLEGLGSSEICLIASISSGKELKR